MWGLEPEMTEPWNRQGKTEHEKRGIIVDREEESGAVHTIITSSQCDDSPKQPPSPQGAETRRLGHNGHLRQPANTSKLGLVAPSFSRSNSPPFTYLAWIHFLAVHSLTSCFFFLFLSLSTLPFFPCLLFFLSFFSPGWLSSAAATYPFSVNCFSPRASPLVFSMASFPLAALI